MDLLRAIFSQNVEPGDVVQLYEVDQPIAVEAIEKKERVVTLVFNRGRSRRMVTYGLPIILAYRSSSVDACTISSLCRRASEWILCAGKEGEDALVKLGDAIDAWRLNRQKPQE